MTTIGPLIVAIAIVVGLLINARRMMQRDIRQHEENMQAAGRYPAITDESEECCHDR